MLPVKSEAFSVITVIEGLLDVIVTLIFLDVLQTILVKGLVGLYQRSRKRKERRNVLKYAVVKFNYFEDVEGEWIASCDLGMHFTDIKEAEKFRSSYLDNHEVNPQNVQVIQYAI